MADYTYPFSAFVNAPLGPAEFKLQKELDPLGWVVGFSIDNGPDVVMIKTDHDLTAPEKASLDAVVAAHTGKPDIEPFRGCCLPTYATTADLPSDAEMAARAGPCMVIVDTPLQLAIWRGTWKFVPLP